MRLNSAAAPATVFDDKPLRIHSIKGKEKVRTIHKPGDLPNDCYKLSEGEYF
jgi:hypothetical protein